VYPDLLDFQIFCNALRKALALYPMFGGRLQKLEDGWKVRYIDHFEDPLTSLMTTAFEIKFESKGVPVDHFVSNDPYERSIPSHGQHFVIQSSLQAFVSPLKSAWLAHNEDAPLAAFRLTDLPKSRQTVLGFSFSYVIGM
jgi:hypothetical protein